MDSPRETAARATNRASIDKSAISRAPSRPPGVWSGFGIVAMYFLLQFGLSLMIGSGLIFVLMLQAGLRHERADARSLALAMRASPDFRSVLAVLTMTAAAIVMTVLVRQFWRTQWTRGDLPGFGFVQPGDKSAYLGAVLLGVGVLLLGGPLTHVLAGAHPVHQDITVMAGKVSPAMRLLLAVPVVCVAPFVEELVFRGVLLSGLASRLHTGWAIVASAIVFGCVHLPDFGFAWYPIPALVVMGLALAWMRVRSGSLWPSITLHATNNLFAMLAWFLASKPH